MIVGVVSPCVVDGHAGFPELKVSGRRDAWMKFFLHASVYRVDVNIFGGNGFWDELLGCNIVARYADAVVDQCWRLQLVDEIEEALAVILLLIVQAIEPD